MASPSLYRPLGAGLGACLGGIRGFGFLFGVGDGDILGSFIRSGAVIVPFSFKVFRIISLI
jgi:hypothetical protein